MVAPVGKSFALIGVLFDMFKKVVDGMTHVDWGQFTMVVCQGPDASKLKVDYLKLTARKCYLFRHIFQGTSTTISVSEHKKRPTGRFKILIIRKDLSKRQRNSSVRPYLVVDPCLHPQLLPVRCKCRLQIMLGVFITTA